MQMLKNESMKYGSFLEPNDFGEKFGFDWVRRELKIRRGDIDRELPGVQIQNFGHLVRDLAFFAFA